LGRGIEGRSDQRNDLGEAPLGGRRDASDSGEGRAACGVRKRSTTSSKESVN